MEHFLGPQPGAERARHPGGESVEAGAAGLELVDVRCERLRTESHDVGAVIYFLREVVWTVPGFTVAAHRDRLREPHDRIEHEERFVAHSPRRLFEARKP